MSLLSIIFRLIAYSQIILWDILFHYWGLIPALLCGLPLMILAYDAQENARIAAIEKEQEQSR